MLKDATVFSGFSVDDLAEAKKFYNETLGIKVTEQKGMGITLHLGHSAEVFIYEKPDHQPATYTNLNFVVEDIDAAIDEMTAAGVVFEHYDDLGGGAVPDEKGVLRGLSANMGPDIAWFKDPAGNTLAILQTK